MQLVLLLLCNPITDVSDRRKQGCFLSCLIVSCERREPEDRLFESIFHGSDTEYDTENNDTPVSLSHRIALWMFYISFRMS